MNVIRLILPAACLLAAPLFAQEKKHLALESPYASYVDESFPFFGQVLDARKFGEREDNLTPRGVILNLGHGVHACFDTDLLRLALVWKATDEGEWLTMNSMSAGSYRLPEQKAPPGQGSLPKPLGTLILENGIYPGWFLGEGEPDLKDPRERGMAQEGEVGIGPLPPKLGKWKGLRMVGNGVRLEYEIGGIAIRETVSYHPERGVERLFSLDPHEQTLQLVREVKGGKPVIEVIAPSKVGQGFLLRADGRHEAPNRERANAERWRSNLTLGSTSLPAPAAFDLVEITQPQDNPWKRQLRVSGFDFFSDGRAAFVTFDGDVWIASGLTDKLEKITWRRVGAGLHEPMGLEIVDDKIYVYDRNALMRLNDENGDGEIDFYEAFCHLVPHTAETREFANDLHAKPGGGFSIAKGGQIGTTWGKYNGTVIEIAADGQSFKRVAYGLRQPYLGVDPKTGLVTASDQQGNWVPTTPVRVIGGDNYHGFQPEPMMDKVAHPAPIVEPPVWIPHFASSSAASQVWLRDARMGPLNDALILAGYHRPEIFRVHFDESGTARQGAVTSLVSGFPTGLLKGRVHPVDGSLWLAGFKIWGTSGKEVSGVYRLRMSGAPFWTPTDVRSSDRGVLLRFAQPVETSIAANLASYSVDRWNYVRSHNYGSGNYRLDGKPGQETVPVASVYLSTDKKAVFLGIPGMVPVHSMRVTYKVPAPGDPLPPGEAVQHAYLTIHQNNPIDLRKEGFGDIEVDMKVRALPGLTTTAPEPSIELGKQVYLQYGCIACHTVDGSKTPAAAAAASGGPAATQVVVGPTWLGLWGAPKKFADGSHMKSVDEAYLRESILDPTKRVSEGFEMSKTGVGMPSYLGVLKDHEIDSLILYIRSLEKKKK